MVGVDHEQEIVVVAQCRQPLADACGQRASAVVGRKHGPRVHPAVERREREGERIGQVGLDLL